MGKREVTAFGDDFLKSAGDWFMTTMDIKEMRAKEKRLREETIYKRKEGKTKAKREIATMLFKERQKKRAAEQPLRGQQFKAQKEAEILEAFLTPIKEKMSKGEPLTQEDLNNLYMYRTYKKTEVTGMPGGAGKGAKTQSLSDIQKTYRKDFIHEEAQKWFSDVTKAVENNDWDTFMALGKDIQGLETRISQGIAGTSEVVRSQISSATAFWSTILEQLTPELYKIPGAQPEPTYPGGAGAGIGAQVPEGLEAEVHAAQDLFDAGNAEEASKKLNELIKAHDKDLIESLMR